MGSKKPRNETLSLEEVEELIDIFKNEIPMRKNKKLKRYTNILTAKNGFLQGIMRTFDLFGVTNSYDTSKMGGS